jgi:hypothetical protein
VGNSTCYEIVICPLSSYPLLSYIAHQHVGWVEPFSETQHSAWILGKGDPLDPVRGGLGLAPQLAVNPRGERVHASAKNVRMVRAMKMRAVPTPLPSAFLQSSVSL